MRPGMVFVGMFLLLAVVYQALADSLPLALIFLVQAATVVTLLALALWWRRRREGRGAGDHGDREMDDA